MAQPELADIQAVTADARLYGFHCTLKPPMRLSTSYAEFRADVLALAQSLRPFELPRLAEAELSGFLALRETRPSPELQALADSCVAWVDHHRAQPSEDELERRRKEGLAPDREALLRRWGYPGVFGGWRFHMTLTRRLTDGERSVYRPAAEQRLAAALPCPRRVASLCIFTQAAPGFPFVLAERVPFGS